MRSEWTSAAHRFRKAHHAQKLKQQAPAAQTARTREEDARIASVARAKRKKKGTA